MVIKQELIDELLSDYKNPEDLLGDGGIFKELKKALLERALKAELGDHLGYEKSDPKGRKSGNSRNGHGAKKLTGEDGEMTISVPRDRDASFAPKIVQKGQRRFEGFDDKIISMYARGMSVREIRGHLEELYGVGVSPDLISRVTDEVMDEVRDWQDRPLDEVHPIIIFDALRVKIRDEGVVRNKAVYLALGFTIEGHKEILGLWIEQTEGAKFWLRVMTEIKNRGGRRRLHRRRRWPQGFPRGDQRSVPRDQRSDLHRAHDPPQSQLCWLEGTQGRGRRPEINLPGRNGAGGGPKAR